MLLTTAVLGCSSGGATKPSDAESIQADKLLGKWHLVHAEGQPPAALNVKSLQTEIAADGTWKSAIEMQGEFEGIRMEGGGNWSLVDGTIAYTSGANSGESKASLDDGRLILVPDFTLRREGTFEVRGEYER